MRRRSWFGFAVAGCLATGCWASHDPSSTSGPIGEWPGIGGARPVVTPTSPGSGGSIAPSAPSVAGSIAPERPPTAPVRPTPPAVSRPPSRPGSGGITGTPIAGAGVGAGGSSGSAAVGGGGNSGATATPTDPILPEPTQPCPMLTSGTLYVRGTEVQLWVGPRSSERRGPLLFYWHGGGDPAAEVLAIGPTALQEFLDGGGVVAAVIESTGTGMPTGIGWSTGDFEIADEIVACASRQLPIDPRRIYGIGSLGGAQHTAAMAFLRSSYVAAIVSNTGGLNKSWPPLANGALPAVLSVLPELSNVGLFDFSALSQRLCSNIIAYGGFAVECAHPGDPTVAPTPLLEAAWRFLIDHPFGAQPSPYAAGLPADFPEYCRIYR